MRPTSPRDEGSATVYTLALFVPVLLAMVVVFALTTALLARHRCGTAADLAALAAAGHLSDGPGIACDWATRIASSDGARLLACSCDAVSCLVTASVPLSRQQPGWGSAVVRARAGRLLPELSDR